MATGILGFMVLMAAQSPATPAYWGQLRPGPHPVGFSQRWVMDSTRRLPGGDSLGLRFRPILMSLWYPALVRPGAAAPMRYRDYFDGAVRTASTRSGLARYAMALAAYQRRVAMGEVLDRGRDTIPAMRERFDSLLEKRTLVRRDIPMRRGRLAVVVYTSGSRSSYDENAVLCEYLASHGYLVVGSAFPNESNEDFTTSAQDESRQRDIRRLLLEVMRLPGVDPGPVIAIGHSTGAQTMLLFAADPSAPIDALFAFDTTQDYALLSDRTWSYFTDRVIERRAEVRVPIVFAASPTAFFELGDSLAATRRWFVGVPDVSHNDFLSQGIMRRDVSAGMPDHDAARARLAQHSYQALVTYTRAWLDWFTGSAAEGPGPAAPAPLELAYAPAGERAPKATSGVPSARAMRHVFTTAPESAFADAFLRARTAGAPAGGNDALSMLLTGAIAQGSRARAGAAYSLLRARDSTVSRVVAQIANRARVFERIQADDLARLWWGYVAVLDPAAEIPAKYR